jgi:hypothetical protein
MLPGMLARAGIKGALAVAALAALVGLACSSGGGPSRPAPGVYESAAFGYGFTYPGDWPNITDKIALSLEEEGPKVLESVAFGEYDERTGFLDGVHVFVVEINETVTPDNIERHFAELDDAFRKQSAAVGGKMTPPTDAELDGVRARQYLVEFVYGGLAQTQAASAQTIAFIGNRQYAVNCQGRASTFNEKVLPGCEQVLQTLRFADR